MNNQPIGILDSGVGGLSIWKEIVRELSHESTIYIADSLNCPYGNKSSKEIYRLAKCLVMFMIDQHVKLIVLACNTITVSCLDKLRKEFPAVPIVGTVPVIKTAAERSMRKQIGILSTKRTAQSSYYKNLTALFASDCKMVTVENNVLVSFVEKGEIKGRRLELTLKRILAPFLKVQIDSIALGCTHFTFLKPFMQKILGNTVILLDSGGAIARQVRRVLTHNDNLSSLQNPSHVFYTTGDINQFRHITKMLLKQSANMIKQNLFSISL